MSFNGRFPTARPRVARGGMLVAGGGFAGSHVARGLGDATVVNPTVVDLWAKIPGADLLAGSVVGLDPERRIAVVRSEGGQLTIAYAELIVALGSEALTARLGLPVDERGRVRVDETLRVIGTPHVWALGECAAAPIDGDVIVLANRLARHLRGDERSDG
jgi:NADH dehydrogenase FAD-containing subunit